MDFNRRYLFAATEVHLVDTSKYETTPALCGVQPPNWSKWYGSDGKDSSKAASLPLCTNCAKKEKQLA